MPISIDSYKRISQFGDRNANSKATVVLERNNLGIGLTEGKNSTSLNFLQRLFNTSDSKRINDRTSADFLQSLSAEYGPRIGKLALERSGFAAGKGNKLTKDIIRTAIGEAERSMSLNAFRLRNPNVNLMLDRDIQDERALGKIIANSNELLSAMVFDAKDKNDWIDDYNAVTADIQDRIRQSSDPNEKQDLETIRSQLQEKLRYFPVSLSGNGQKIAEQETLRTFVGRKFDALRETLLDMGRKKLGDGSEQFVKFQSAVNEKYSADNIGTLAKIIIDFDKKGTVSNEFKEYRSAARDMLKGLNKKLYGEMCEFVKDWNKGIHGNQFGNTKISTPSNKKFNKAVENSFVNVLSRTQWKPVTKTIQIGIDNTLESTVTPGSKLTEKQRLEPGVNGVPCHATKSEHAVNLAKTDLQLNGKKIFSGFRHAVHSAFGLHGAPRREACVSRAKEHVVALFMNSPSLKKLAGNVPNGGEFKFNMTSVSLLSPGKLDFICGDEKSMVKDQMRAWNVVQENGVEVKIGAKTIKLKPDICKFNFPVNKLAFGFLSITRANSESEDYNRVAMRSFLNRIDLFLRDTSGEEDLKLKDNLRKLKSQIEDILSEGKSSKDPYALPARIAVASYLMGEVPSWNCKSGKDRTGLMDVECKFLATLIAQGRDLPNPGSTLSYNDETLLRNLMLQSGNLEMQEMNTGLGGYKTSGISSNETRMGGPNEAVIMQRGYADVVKA